MIDGAKKLVCRQGGKLTEDREEGEKNMNCSITSTGNYETALGVSEVDIPSGTSRSTTTIYQSGNVEVDFVLPDNTRCREVQLGHKKWIECER